MKSLLIAGLLLFCTGLANAQRVGIYPDEPAAITDSKSMKEVLSRVADLPGAYSGLIPMIQKPIGWHCDVDSKKTMIELASQSGKFLSANAAAYAEVETLSLSDAIDLGEMLHRINFDTLLVANDLALCSTDSTLVNDLFIFSGYLDDASNVNYALELEMLEVIDTEWQRQEEEKQNPDPRLPNVTPNTNWWYHDDYDKIVYTCGAKKCLVFFPQIFAFASIPKTDVNIWLRDQRLKAHGNKSPLKVSSRTVPTRTD